MLVEIHVLMHEASSPLLPPQTEILGLIPCGRGSLSPSLRPLWCISELVYLQLQHQQYHITQNVFYLERVHVVSAETMGEKQKSEERC